MNVSANCLFSGSSLASEVHAAAVNGDKNAIQKLIAGNSELKDKEDQFGRTPLMYCVLADRLDCAEALLKAGADVNRADHSQRTALHLAAQKGNYRFMKLLLARRGNWMQKDLEDMTPLHLTTRHKSPKCLALLLKHMAPGEVDTQDRNKEAAPTESLLNWQDYEGRTPLHFAVADGNIAVVDVLTSYEGCNVTSYDNLFRTPLHWAALLGHAQIVHLLLERNKFGTIPSDSQGATPLHYAAQSNFAETVEVFLKHPSVKDDSDLEGRTSFMWAAGKGSDDVIRTMLNLKLDIDINMTDKYAGTALHAAALSGHVNTVKLLLEHNAQVDALDVMKHTPLFRACEMGHKEVIQTLIKGGARVDLVDQDGHSPLHWAALGGNADVCQILIENKINPNVQDYAGRTPLQCAAYGGYINCMVVLLENKADPNIQDKEGRTALHWLCNNGYLDAIKLLLGFDAFPNHMENSEERYTPLDYALLGEHHEVIQFMLEHGALSIAAIQDIAAFKIQAVYKGYKVRKAFQERKNLLMKHEQLRKDAAAKKREEESKRKEAKLQKGMQNLEQNRFRVQQNFGNQEKTTNVMQLPKKQSDMWSKRPPSCNTSQAQAGRNSGGSLKAYHSKRTPKESCLSTEPQSEGHKIRQAKELLRKHTKSKSTCIHFHCGKENEGRKSEMKHQVAAATELDGEKHNDYTIKENDAFAHGSRKHTSVCTITSVGEKSRVQGQSSSGNGDHCEGTAVFLCNASCTGGIARNSRHHETVSKGKRHHQKSRNKEVNDERCSPAGSSRPGSAKMVFVSTRNDSVHAVEQTNNVGNNELAKKTCPLLSTAAESTRNVPRNPSAHSVSDDSLNLEKTDIIGSRNVDDQLCSSVTWQSMNIEQIPLEIRMQVIEKERTRKELFRKKNHAATVIQRTWRSYQLRQELFQLLRAKRQCKDEDKWRQETAAFFIQVAWKKQLSHSPLKSDSSCKNLKSTNKASSAIKTSKQSILKQIYGRSQEGKAYQPARPPSKLKLSAVHLASVNNLQYVNLLENMGKSKQFSYNMRSTTAAKLKNTRLKH
ncbi:inversin isoform X4 [Apteryx mantelli]|uniref:Inversin isoform X4 n=1 Tax=Apteryx mantelli TaxID=2696672 RepID=A0ABM4E3C7_9AVES